MIPEKQKPCAESLWGLYSRLQKQLLDAKVDECIDLICKIHDCCSEILSSNPNNQIAMEMETVFLPSMIIELCDLDMERMEYIFGDVDY